MLDVTQPYANFLPERSIFLFFIMNELTLKYQNEILIMSSKLLMLTVIFKLDACGWLAAFLGDCHCELKFLKVIDFQLKSSCYVIKMTEET